jgi:hypothetical protein
VPAPGKVAVDRLTNDFLLEPPDWSVATRTASVGSRRSGGRLLARGNVLDDVFGISADAGKKSGRHCIQEGQPDEVQSGLIGDDQRCAVTSHAVASVTTPCGLA